MSSTAELVRAPQDALEDRRGVYFLVVDDDPADQLICKLMLKEIASDRSGALLALGHRGASLSCKRER